MMHEPKSSTLKKKHNHDVYLVLGFVFIITFLIAYNYSTSYIATAPSDRHTAEWERLSISEDLYHDWFGFDDVAFHNVTHGWLWGEVALLKTTDGGDTWDPILKFDDGKIFSISIVDHLTMWACMYMGSAATGHRQNFRTTDGGLNWTPTETPNDSWFVSYYNSSHGFVLDLDGLVYRTFDGGETLQETDNTIGTPNSAYLTESLIRIATWSGLFMSEDWGLTWITEETGFVRGMSFISTSEGWTVHHSTVGHYYQGTVSQLPNVYTLRESHSRSFYDVEFVDSENGWIVGLGPSIIYTPDGGDSWFDHDTADYVLKSVDFINETHGWATGWEGVVLRTRNGDGLGPRMLPGLWLPSSFTQGGILIPTFSVIVAGGTSLAIVGILGRCFKQNRRKLHKMGPE